MWEAAELEAQADTHVGRTEDKGVLGMSPTNVNLEIEKEQNAGGTANFVLFTILGTAALLVWNGVLSFLADFNTLMDGELNDTVSATFMTFTVFTSLYLMKKGAANLFIMYLGILMSFVSCLLLPLITQTTETTTGSVLIHVLMFPLGVSCGMIQMGAMAVASILKPNQCGAVSFGMGVSGVVSFALAQTIQSAVKPDGDRSKMRMIMWIFFCCLSTVYVLSALALRRLQSQPWLRRALVEASKKTDQGGEANEEGQQEYNNNNNIDGKNKYYEIQDDNFNGIVKGSIKYYLRVLKVSRVPIFCLFTTIFVTLQMFPNVGPVRWDKNQVVLLVGMYQIGDFIGRYVPNIGSKVPFVLFKEKFLLFAVIARILFIPLFVLMFKYGTDSSDPDNVLSSLASQIIIMLIFAVSNGWYLSLSFMYTPTHTKDRDVQSTASTIGLLGMYLGITGGLWISKLYTL